MSKFINLSNHSSDNWSAPQIGAAKKYGEIIDISFPQIPPTADSLEIDRLVNEYLEILSKHEIGAVMLQGEFVFTYRLVKVLKERGITVVCACSERRVQESTDSEGRTQRISVFEFIQFREY